MASGLFSRSPIRERSWSVLTDAAVFAVVAAAFYGVLAIARYWSGAMTPAAEISRSPRVLPTYAFYSLVRIGSAYVLSLIFAVGYGYVAVYQKRVEAVMVAILDILQSIPVLSFLPGVMLAMVALFPRRQLGVELGSIVLIFTGQVWNMAFSFYASLKSIPRELHEAADIYGFGRWQRFIELELPYGAIGLVWNSIVSVAGGWFFLMACEMFVLGNRDFRLPGLGSYLQTAAGAGDGPASGVGLGRHDRGDRAHGSVGMAPGDRLVGPVQVRAGGTLGQPVLSHPPRASKLRRHPLAEGFARWRPPGSA